MKIAVWHYLPSGGGKRALYDHVTGLLARGHTVESWCPPGSDQTFLSLADLIVEHVVPMRDPEAGRLRRALSAASRRATMRYSMLRAFDEHARRCAVEMESGGFDMLLAASSLHMAASPIGRCAPLPSVLYLQEPNRYLYEALPRLPWAAPPTARSLLEPLFRVRDAFGVRAMRIQAREELRNVSAFDRVLANSLFSRESILRAYGVEARVCYLGVDCTRYRNQQLPRRHMVVGVGAFARHKRIDVAIEAVAELADKELQLIWIGNVADHEYLRELSTLAATREVNFEPLVDIHHRRVVDLLNEAAAMIYAPRLEPFGYAPLEAAACGLPVVAVAEGGVRETIIDGETGVLVGNDDELGGALARVVNDNRLARRMGEAARRHVEEAWSLDQATDRLEAHLQRVAAGAAAPTPTGRARHRPL